MKKVPLFFFVFSFLFCPPPAVPAEDSLLKIQALPDQNTVNAGMMFLVNAQVLNSSSDTSSDFWSNTCSYEKHWVTDNPEVFIQPWTCNDNALEEITLAPGDIYQKNIMLYVPQKDKTGAVTFRLGFKRMSENGDIAEPLWGDPVTIRVIVPEEIKDAPAAGATFQTMGQPSAGVTDKDEMPPAAGPESAISAMNPFRVFQDPGVPIKVKPGEEFSISLTSNPSTGFRWKLSLPGSDKTVTLSKFEYVAPEKMMPGAPGQEVYKFKAVTPGETKADFVYHRPWETVTAPPRKIFTILVQED